MTQSKTKLFKLINDSNFPPVPFSDDNVAFSGLAPSTELPGWNTRVVLEAKAGKGYSGVRTVFYRRLSLSLISSTTVLHRSDFTDQQSLLDALNAQYGTFIDLVDLEAFVLPEVPTGGAVPITLQARPDSYGWIDAVTMFMTQPQTDCDAPAPVPTRTPHYWWTRVNTRYAGMEASPYGGILALEYTEAGATLLSDTGVAQWTKGFTSELWPEAMILDGGAYYQDNFLAQLQVFNGAQSAIGLVEINRSSGVAVRSVILDVQSGSESARNVVSYGGCIFTAIEDAGWNSNARGSANSYWSAVVLKLNQDGRIGWQKRIQRDGLTKVTSPTKLAVDVNENVIAVVHSSPTGAVGNYVLKFDKAGNLLWQVQLDGLEGDVHVATFSNGSIAVLAEAQSMTQSVLLRLSASGQLLWATSLDKIPENNSTVQPNDVAVDGDDNIFVLTEGFLLKFSPAGGLLWQQSLLVTNSHALVYIWDSMSVRGHEVQLTVGDASSETQVVFNLPVDGSVMGDFAVPNAVLTIASSTLVTVTENTATTVSVSTLTVADANLTAAPGDIQTTNVILTWQAPVSLDVGPPQIDVTPGVLAQGYLFQPARATFSDSGEQVQFVFGQYAMEYHNGDTLVRESTGGGPLQLSDGNLLHYQIWENPSDSTLPGTAGSYLVPPGIDVIPESGLLDGATQSEFISWYNAKIPFEIAFKDAQGRVLNTVKFSQPTVANPDNTYAIPTGGASNLFWRYDTNLSLVASIDYEIPALAPGVVRTFIFPMPALATDSNGDTTPEAGVFGMFNEDRANFAFHLAAMDLNLPLLWYAPIFERALLHIIVTEAADASTPSQVLLKIDNQGEIGLGDTLQADGVYTHRAAFNTWWDSVLPLQVELMDLDGNAVGTAIYTDNTAAVGADKARVISVPNLIWRESDIRKVWSIRVTPNVGIG